MYRSSPAALDPFETSLRRRSGNVLAKSMTAGRFDVRNLFVAVFLWASIALGSVVVVWSLLNWHCDDPARFLSFLATAMVASVLRVRIPRSNANVSVSALFVLIGIVNLSLPEAVMLGTLGMLTQGLAA